MKATAYVPFTKFPRTSNPSARASALHVNVQGATATTPIAGDRTPHHRVVVARAKGIGTTTRAVPPANIVAHDRDPGPHRADARGRDHDPAQDRFLLKAWAYQPIISSRNTSVIWSVTRAAVVPRDTNGDVKRTARPLTTCPRHHHVRVSTPQLQQCKLSTLVVAIWGTSLRAMTVHLLCLTSYKREIRSAFAHINLHLCQTGEW